jgi:hypothetical protein
MKPMAVLVVSVVCLANGMFWALVFAFGPSIRGGRDYWGWFAPACLVLLLIWLSVKIVQRKRLAWHVGAVVYAPVGLLGLLTIPMYVMQSFVRVDLRQAMPLRTCLLCLVYTVAYVMLYAHRGVRQLFRPPQASGEAKAAIDDPEARNSGI